MSVGDNISQPYPGPDDGDPPFRDVARSERAPHPFKAQTDVDHLVRAGLWGPAEVEELERRRKAGEWPDAKPGAYGATSRPPAPHRADGQPGPRHVRSVSALPRRA